MVNQEYLKAKQPILYQTFANAIKNHKLSHAFLLVGEHGTPLKETALYLAKTLLCEHPYPFACNECTTCRRVDNNQYADLIICDGETDSIKKDSVDRIMETFSRTAMENNGKVIYILHLVENATIEAINSILKFLEEPGKDTYAFLTTQNESRVLPTIVSRSQRLTLKLIPREEVIKDAKDLPVDDVEILSYFYNDAMSIREKINDENYLMIKEIFNHFIEHLNNQQDLLYTVETELIPNLHDKEDARFFFDLLASFLQDVVRASNGEKIFLTSYDKIIKDLATRLKHPTNSLLEVMNLRSQIDLNITLASIYEHLAIYLTKE
ncbi:MAG: hypothetical protein MJ207_00850 [Bacilli bacterium]|nr:hypothetical protein [Bacilli bacterium]